MLYWEFKDQTAVRMKNWKAIQPHADAEWELYDLGKDLSETSSVADQHPGIVEQMVLFAKLSHQEETPGTYSDRTRHERDRWAKWGTSREK